MAKTAKIINISEIQTSADLLCVVEEVRATRVPAVLRGDSEDLVELRPAKPRKTKAVKSKVFTKDDPLWGIAGMFKDDGGPTDVSANVDKNLAEAYSDPHV